MSEEKITAQELHKIEAKVVAAANEKLMQRMLDSLHKENELVYQREQNGLRDRMAIAAMQGMLANNILEGVKAKHCYQIADAMLKERNK